MTPAPKDTIWPLPPQTIGKHEILRHYLSAWFPIIGSFAPRLAFIDGFAGPGHYAGGEPGSPLIALGTFHTYAASVKGEAVFLFVEEDEERADHLRETIASQGLPPNCKAEVTTGHFEPQMTAILDSMPAGQELAPAFLMLDRFKAASEFEGPLTELYGTDEWKKGLNLEGIEKREFLLGLYREQLRRSGAKHVLRFDLYKGGRLEYAIFFATNHWKGADVMKREIWKIAPFGDFSFRSGHRGQLVLGIDTADFTPLREPLQSAFR